MSTIKFCILKIILHGLHTSWWTLFFVCFFLYVLLQSHSFLVLQYVASFILHNVPLKRKNELHVGSVDNLAIASHICLLAWLGLPFKKNRLQFLLKTFLLGTLGQSFLIAGTQKDATRSWSYKVSLMPIFIAGACSC